MSLTQFDKRSNASKSWYKANDRIKTKGVDFDDGLPVMSSEAIKEVAVLNGGFETSELNDSLYLHYKGWRKIENLDEYLGLKSLWLDSNGFQKVENLNHLSALRCLFLQRNLITKIENIDCLQSLVQLDLSENRISCVSGLSSLENLTTLNLAKNFLVDAKGIQHLGDCKNLSVVDLSNNELKGDDVISTLSKIKCLTALNITGNPVLSEVSHFRKKCINAIKKLRYLDMPIFDEERASAESWGSGGREDELKTKREWKKKKRDEERKGMEDFRAWKASIRAKKEKELSLILSQGPHPEQIAVMDLNKKLTEQRKEAASREAEREKGIYRIQPEVCQKKNIHAIYNNENNEEKPSSDLLQKNLKMKDKENSAPEEGGNKKIALVSNEVNKSIEANKNNKNIVANQSSISKDDIIKTQSFDEENVVGNEDEGKKKYNGKDTKGKSTKKIIQSTSRGTENDCGIDHANYDATNRPGITSFTEGGPKHGMITIKMDVSKEEERNERVRKSLSIYHEQKKGKESINNSCCPILPDPSLQKVKSTEITGKFHNLLVKAIHTTDSNIKGQFTWSDAMDTDLTKCVHESIFDFSIVAASMKDMYPLHSESFTPPFCRLRWCDIDEQTKSHNSHNLNNRISHIFTRLDGKQISYEELEKRAVSEPSQALCPPKIFPKFDEWKDDKVDAILKRDEIWSMMSVEKNFNDLD